MTAYEQRSYPGAAADTLLNADVASTGLTFSVTPGTGSGYPDGTGGPFFVILDYDNSKAEKVRCTGRVNDTFTVPDVGSRGVDGTTAQAHTANAKVRAVWTATDAQESNRAAHYTVGLVAAKGDLTPGAGSNQNVRLPVGPNNSLLIADSSQASGLRYTTSPTLDNAATLGGVSGATLATEHAAQTATLTLGGQTSLAGSGTLVYYQTSSKWLVGDCAITTSASSTGDGWLIISGLPAQAVTETNPGKLPLGVFTVVQSSGEILTGNIVTSQTAGQAMLQRPSTFNALGASDPYRPASGDPFYLSFSYRLA